MEKEVLNGLDGQSVLSFLGKYMPYSVNAIGSVVRHPDRTRVVVSEQNGQTEGVGVIFNSRYNPHIWHDPVVWLLGSNQSHTELLGELTGIAGGSYVVHMPGGMKMSSLIADSSDMLYEEILMGVSVDTFRQRNPSETEPIRMGSEFASEVFTLLTESHDISVEEMEKESRFLRERVGIGVLHGDRLVSFGAIMSVENGASTIGAIKTESSYRRRGLSASTVSSLVIEALKDSELVTLFVRADNEPAISLYRSLGFTEMGRTMFVDHGTGLKP